MSNEDDFVEKLLQGLPKAPPMSPLEIKRFEKHVDSLVAADAQKTKSKNRNSRFTVAASVMALVAGVAIFTNSSEVINNPTNSGPGPAINSPSPTTSGGGAGTGQEETTGTPESNGSSSGNSGSAPSVNGITKSPAPGSSEKSVPVLDYGIEYTTSESAARSKVSKVATLGDSKLLSSSQISCSVRLGIDEELFAIDRGTYDGEEIEAYYFGKTKESLDIKIVGFGCSLIKDL